MYEKLLNKRIFHVSAIIAFGLFLAQILEWPQATWIPISILAIIGPFRPGMTIDKSKQRMLGTIAGLLLTVISSEIIRHFPLILIPLIIVIIFFYAYVAFDPDKYKYMIMMTTLFIGTNYAYMNPPFYGEFSLFLNRLIAVFAGVAIYLFAEVFIFKRHYNNATCIIEHEAVNELVHETSQNILKTYYKQSFNIQSLNTQLSKILQKKSDLLAHKKSSLQGLSQQDKTLELIEFYIQKLDRCIVNLKDIGSGYLFNEQFSLKQQTELSQLLYLKPSP
ncbi:FUSC family protein [Francisellaceae bacterium]|nr:FUSC family protein [Francisellaceae bacterium]